ncbi:MAG: hypothetical protein II721_00155, partial [Bacilli bacterium]|nr:hypothetical protein [Bacilli bacterium]
ANSCLATIGPSLLSRRSTIYYPKGKNSENNAKTEYFFDFAQFWNIFFLRYCVVKYRHAPN